MPFDPALDLADGNCHKCGGRPFIENKEYKSDERWPREYWVSARCNGNKKEGRGHDNVFFAVDPQSRQLLGEIPKPPYRAPGALPSLTAVTGVKRAAPEPLAPPSVNNDRLEAIEALLQSLVTKVDTYLVHRAAGEIPPQ
jgi:hypothetical protein